MLRLDESRAVRCRCGLRVYNLSSSSAAVTKPHSDMRAHTFSPYIHYSSRVQVSMKEAREKEEGKLKRKSIKAESENKPERSLHARKD